MGIKQTITLSCPELSLSNLRDFVTATKALHEGTKVVVKAETNQRDSYVHLEVIEEWV
jgi:hypothetical protein